MTEYHFERVGKNKYVAVNDCHCFGTDAVLLADFARIHFGDKVCELCAGCGVISILSADKTSKPITAVEIQSDASTLISVGSVMSCLAGKIISVNADLRQLSDILPANEFDSVVINPPYFKVGSGFSSPSDFRRMIRTEEFCEPKDFAFSASRLLKSGGRLFLCHRPERLCDIISALIDCRLEPKRLRFVSVSPSKKPWLFLLEARLDANSGIDIEKPLFMDNEDEIKRIYGEYADFGR